MAAALDDPGIRRRLTRRVGLGPLPHEVDGLAATDPRTVAERLLGASPGADPWGDDDHTVQADAAPGERRRVALTAIARWIDALSTTGAPAAERVAWWWHGHFVSALPDVKNPQFLVDQMRLFRSGGRGRFGDLVRSITVDPAMLLYLDGSGSTGDAPNENYSRELLELFTIGQGGYDEADVAAGAAALSGWRVRPGADAPVLVGRRHDDTPRRYLGIDGVHDVDTVVAALERHPDLAPYVARQWAREIVGPAVGDSTVTVAADAFAASGHDLDVLLRSLVDAVIGGADGGEVVTAPLPWFVATRRITGAAPDARAVLQHLGAAGQVPWFPPNVAGWPSGAAWDNAATVVARLHLAQLVARATPADAEVLQADDRRLADLLLVPAWSSSTAAALGAVSDPRDRLVLALVSPEFVRC